MRLGRPTIKKSGEPLTPAERQARRYGRLHKSINRKRKAHYKQKKQGNTLRQRHQASLNAAPLPDGMEYREGDCCEMFNDIEDEKVAVIITDPAYGNASELHYRWLAMFAARVLIQGGSLISYTGSARLDRDMAIFGEHLRYGHLAVMLHDARQKLFNPGALVNYKPILWYTKGQRRGGSLVPLVIDTSKRDKSAHPWAQGDAGVRQWIHHLTEPGELIIDPFAGTGTWGRIAAEMGRRWIGCDLKRGGTTTVVAVAPAEAAD